MADIRTLQPVKTVALTREELQLIITALSLSAIHVSEYSEKFDEMADKLATVRDSFR